MRIAVMIAVGITSMGCTGPQAPIALKQNLAFLTREGCVNTTTMKANLDDALRLLGQRAVYQVVDLDTLPDSDVRRGYPTPTVLVSNRDLFDMTEPQPPFPTPT